VKSVGKGAARTARQSVNAGTWPAASHPDSTGRIKRLFNASGPKACRKILGRIIGVAAIERTHREKAGR
jgi:hypothetical protein